MASYRPLGQFNQYFLDSGAVNDGGSITFYETDLTTLKDTYSDDGLTILNSNPVLLDAAGRLSTDVWGSGNYGAVIKDRSGVVIETRNNIQSGASAGQVIPALVSGEFLTNDASNLLWQSILQVPDPTGLASTILGNDGTTAYWQSIASLNIPTAPVINSTSIHIGTLKIQWGTGSAPTTGFRQVTAAVTFPAVFGGVPYYVGVMPTSTSVTVGLQLPVPAVTSKATTGFSVQFDSDDFGETNAVFIAAVPFDWFAIGPA